VADVSISEDTLVIELTIPERVVSLHGGSLSVPRRQITKAVAVPDAIAQVRGTRRPGAGVPGQLAIGMWSGDQAGRTFLDFVVVERPGPGVVLTLRGNEYDRIVLGTARPEQVIADLDR
jgi:hypothetical protein